ncbi:small ribosomal subunit protein bS16m-like [Ylistrum balloti]|uniref:small ribosomal subunit protein bS16m-like n=1 Tax=Ylistrum balloti TaxID=509963 RepID=UPI0029059FDE|nr:small ribosomal subunit protein bS16m-like [Ylistrum balloti]
MPRLVDKSKFLVIRLALHGCTNRPFFHIVLARNRSPRNARPIAQLGTYDPMLNTNNEQMVSLNMAKINDVLCQKPKITKTAAKLLGLSGCLPIHPLTYLEAHRATKKSSSISESSTHLEGNDEEEDV